ncbi:MAG TPA: amidase [Quisquiliibacterium sp.]|nr:amidase [Quisquiliibacterium sp.]
MAAFEDYDRYDGLGLAGLVQRGEVRPAELVEAAIARIEARDPALNSVILAMFDQARAAAEGPLPDGPFRGVPMLLKDLIATVAGQPTASGSRALRGLPWPRDSELVTRLRAAGVLLLGKTNTPEFGLVPYTEPEAFGPTRNPWNLAHSPGGSSGGSAAAVAARLVPLATGGDGGGSIRIPASCCGLFGLKVSRGRTPTGPLYGELWHGFASEHVLARSVRDSAAMLDVLAGADVGAPYAAPAAPASFLAESGSEPPPLRIAFTSKPLFGGAGAPVHDDCREALAKTVSLLRDLGHEPVEAAPGIDGEACARAFVTILAAETRATIEEVAQLSKRSASRADYEAATWALGLLGRATPASEYAAASNLLQAASRAVGGFFERYPVLLTPTLAQPPAPIGALQPSAGERRLMSVLNPLGAGWLYRLGGMVDQLAGKTFAYMPYTPLFNVTGQPAMSVPLHWNAAGLPIGLQFAGRFGDEALLLRLAGQLERARPWAARTPALPGLGGAG